jgi:1,4-alpha-glucan branching enzyme
MAMIDTFHNAQIGIILDWVPSHFPYDAHGLFMFDGTHTYEYADMRKGFHPDWNSYIFNYKRDCSTCRHKYKNLYHLNHLQIEFDKPDTITF